MKKEQKQVVKKVNGVPYTLRHQELIERGGKLYKDSFWVEGDGEDVDGDSKVNTITLECKVPEGYNDLDVSLIKEECLFKQDGKLVFKAH